MDWGRSLNAKLIFVPSTPYSLSPTAILYNILHNLEHFGWTVAQGQVWNFPHVGTQKSGSFWNNLAFRVPDQDCPTCSGDFEDQQMSPRSNISPF